MAKVITKNSFTPGSAPSGLSAGEMAVNVADKKLFVGNSVGGVVTLHDQNAIVTSVNGSTGAVTNVAKTDTAQTFSGLQTFSTGISAAGGTFSGNINFINTRSINSTGNLLLGDTTTSTYIGDANLLGNGVYIEVSDNATTLDVVNVAGNLRLGDPDGLYNGYYISIDNTGGLIRINGACETIGSALDIKAGLKINGSAGSNGQVLTSTGTGITWSSISSGTGFTYTSSAPGSPTVGYRWMDSDTGKEYIYINDGDSSQWIQPVASNGLVGITYDATTNSYTVGATLDIKGSVSSDGGYRITSNAINALTGTTYSLLSSDNGKVITWSNASGVTLTVPSGLPVGFNTTVIQIGTGSVGITGSGTTLNSFEGKLRTAGQHVAVSIISYSSNVFNIAGGLTA